jgi:hypothetical protein
MLLISHVARLEWAMKFFAAVAVVSSLASLDAQSSGVRQISMLDLTAPDAVLTVGPIATEGRGRSRAWTEPQPPGLDVRFVMSSQQTFRAGDRFSFELEIRNVGSQPIDFPRSADLASFVPGANNTVANIRLQMRRKDQGWVGFGATMLAGSGSVPGSLQRLEPGDAMLIRLPASVALTGDDLGEFSARGAVPASAVVVLDGGNQGVWWEPVISRNSIPFMIRR